MQTTKCCATVKLCDLVKFMVFTYNLNGDVQSQVQSALNTAESYNFVKRNNDRYSLICPAARLHLSPSLCLKEELKRIQTIFPSKNRKNSTSNLCTSRSSRLRKPASNALCVCPSSGEESRQCPVTRSKRKNKPEECNVTTTNDCPAPSFLDKFWPLSLPKKKRSNSTNTQQLANCGLEKCPATKSRKKRKRQVRNRPRIKCSLEDLKSKILGGNRTKRECTCESTSETTSEFSSEPTTSNTKKDIIRSCNTNTCEGQRGDTSSNSSC
ncbi:unnamed protein product [Ceutorhynchus assimilis]|uniref:Uncharacterized protein n=1 Tax=Ceutorhynchus assimilis TaxID=467358 RepID=A0A9N9QPP2_9CUCU|nr:unnamed protein product [Ceutorhynchus assimilis]